MPSCPHFMDEATIGQRHEGTCLGSQLVSLREDCSPSHLARGSRCFRLSCSSCVIYSGKQSTECLGPRFSARFPRKGAGTAQCVAAA